MSIKYSILLIISSLTSFAQGEANNWYFGQNAAITFNNGAPTALTNSAMQTYEGCATLSDQSGQLLFYTDGRTVYNRNHQIMVNGSDLLGHESSTQSGTIVPLPGSANLYYVFTLDEVAKSNGFRYSIIDLTLDGGLGAVTSTKNVLVYTPSCEKISVVKHANNNDYWVLTHGFGSNNFYSHQLTNVGLSSVPVVSPVGFAPFTASNGTNKNGAAGGMKISPNGQKLAVCYQKSYSLDENVLELYDFNNDTGVVSNAVTLIQSTSNSIYGVEFSPNNKILYATANNSFFLYQFDLEAIDIPNSLVTIFENPASHPNQFRPLSLQLGPDGKIYSAMGSNPFLGCINNPNLLGIGCDFVPNQVDLLGNNSSLGLPVFNQSYFAPAIKVENLCVGQVTEFQLTSSSIVDATWDFGDGSTSNIINPTHTYTAAGTFTVSVVASSSNGTGATTRDIVISEVPAATQPCDVSVCDDNNDGFYNIDLTAYEILILNGQSDSQFNIRYFASSTDFSVQTPISNPSDFINEVAYQPQTIIAEVYNVTNSDCSATTYFTIRIWETPTPDSAILPLRICDNTTFGTISDGKVAFDLTTRHPTLLNNQYYSDFQISYFRDSELADLIVNPSAYVNTNVTETIFVKIANALNADCFAIVSFQIEVLSLPPINLIVNLKQCDNDNDGFSAFNLTEANELVVSSPVALLFSYYETANDAQNGMNMITDFTEYTNSLVSSDQIFARVENDNGCFRVATVNLIVSTTLIPVAFQRIYTVCDNAFSSLNTDGIATFDFSDATPDIEAFYPSGQVLDITYYGSLGDALAEQNAIIDISNFTNTGSPYQQDIFVRVDSQLDNSCLGLGHHITLNVEAIPEMLPLSFTECDDDHDGIAVFDTSTIEAELLNGMNNVTLTYRDENNQSLPSPLPNPFNSSTQDIVVRATNNALNSCYFETHISFFVHDKPHTNSIPVEYTTACDDESDPALQDGLYPFDTSNFESLLLGGQTGMIISYYDTQGNILPSPLPNPFLSGTQQIMVVVTNAQNTQCAATLNIPLIVNPRPNVKLHDEELVCSDDPSFTIMIDAGLVDSSMINDFTYSWFYNGDLIPSANNYDLVINEEGVYQVEVSTGDGCTSIGEITVASSEAAIIESIDIVDFSSNNNVTIQVSGEGDYMYSLDNINYQTGNIFYNVATGVYSVYVKDTKGCGIAVEDINVLGAPAFFTPNGDGFNDTWNINGLSSSPNFKGIIYIYDRYGKLLKQLNLSGTGWDGTFKGSPLPATDYWYTIILRNGRTIRGNFALKR